MARGLFTLVGLLIASWTWSISLFDQSRYSLDSAVRQQYSESADQYHNTFFIGLDFHSVLSDEKGDWGTFVFQSYFTQLNNAPSHPKIFNSGDDSKWMFRIVRLDLTRGSYYQPYFRVGHIEIPFGLEHTWDTNGAVLDYQLMPLVGLKADWGVSAFREYRAFEYEISWTTNSGQEFVQESGIYALSGRVATSRYSDWIAGVSFFESKNNLDQSRIWRAIDGQWFVSRWTLLGQWAVGEFNENDISSSLYEVQYSFPRSDWNVTLQKFEHDLGADYEHQMLVVRWTPDSHWDASLNLKDQTVNDVNSTASIFQLRHRF